MRCGLALVGVVVCALALAHRGAQAAPPASGIAAADFAAFAFQQKPGATLPLDARFRGPDGSTVALGSFFGAVPVVLDFEYDRCATLCGVMLDQVTAALRDLPLQAGRDYRLVAIDIDPEATAADSAAFARRHGASARGMAVLSGAGDDIERVAAAAGFPYRRDPATGQYAHPAGFLIVTPDGRISRYLLGFGWRPLDLRLGLTEAAGETIAAPAESLLLLCYCYDPQTGQYDLAIGRLLDIVGAATLLAIGGLVRLAARRPG
jgi:protein SCO1/2